MASIIDTLRKELEPLNRAILEAGPVKRPTMGVLRRFVANQLYIVPNDLRALSMAMSKARDRLEVRFVKMLVDGDYEAYLALEELAGELGVEPGYEGVDPIAVTYTHFLSWLVVAGTMGDLAVAMTVNLPVWGANCAALAKWARSNGVRSTRFLDLFAGPYEELEGLGEEIASRYLDMARYRWVARAIQTYERAFWDSLI